MKYKKEHLLELDIDQLVVVWNDFCSENSWFEDEVFTNDNDGLRLAMYGTNENDILKELTWKVSKGDYNGYDTHFIVKEGLIYTFSWHNEMFNHIDVDELLKWLNEREEL